MNRAIPSLLVSILWPVLSFGQTPSELSFKGLRLGMTQQEVNRLVADSKWAYLTYGRYGDGTTDMPDTSQSSGVFLAVESKETLYDFTSPTDSFAVIGCKTANEYTECESFNRVFVSYFENKVYQIAIYSGKHAYKYPASIQGFADMAVTAITNKYGKPTKKWSTDYSESDLILLKDDEILNAASWQWPMATKKMRPAFEITIQIDKDPTNYEDKYHNDYKVVIDLTDKKAEARYIEAERIKADRYMQEERNPKIKTDF